MAYRITITSSAAKVFRKMHPQAAKRLKEAIFALADEPRPAGSLKLSGGAGEMRIRVGDYRIVYEIVDDELILLVLRVGHRREIYR
ncbi:type II toxin-antitoxin system RelE family toxin [Microbacterium sp. YY-01]|uniref:type II toxin-antitoxin system RelE family toxin n=1 Tax=Microbacterium sp. YY-01 TaxID=3421634 RepID=UPI003D183295